MHSHVFSFVLFIFPTKYIEFYLYTKAHVIRFISYIFSFCLNRVNYFQLTLGNFIPLFFKRFIPWLTAKCSCQLPIFQNRKVFHYVHTTKPFECNWIYSLPHPLSGIPLIRFSFVIINVAIFVFVAVLIDKIKAKSVRDLGENQTYSIFTDKAQYLSFIATRFLWIQIFTCDWW